MGNYLFIVGMQNDTVDEKSPNPVPYAGDIVDEIMQLKKCFDGNIGIVNQTFPENHERFENTTKYCLKGTKGSELRNTISINKYDLFETCTIKGDNRLDPFGIDNCQAVLKERGVDTIYVCGTCIEEAVWATCKQASGMGYKVYLVFDACRGRNSDKISEAVKDLKKSGVTPIPTNKVFLTLNV